MCDIVCVCDQCENVFVCVCFDWVIVWLMVCVTARSLARSSDCSYVRPSVNSLARSPTRPSVRPSVRPLNCVVEYLLVWLCVWCVSVFGLRDVCACGYSCSVFVGVGLVAVVGVRVCWVCLSVVVCVPCCVVE